MVVRDDSTLTLERLIESSEYEVVAIQAQLVGLPLITIELPEVFPSNEIYQSTLLPPHLKILAYQSMRSRLERCSVMALQIIEEAI